MGGIQLIEQILVDNAAISPNALAKRLPAKLTVLDIQVARHNRNLLLSRRVVDHPLQCVKVGPGNNGLVLLDTA